MIVNDVNPFSALVAAACSLLIGFLWYGPLFGKEWIALMKIKAKDIKQSKDKMPMLYAITIGLAFIQAFILDSFLTLALGFTNNIAASSNVIFITVIMIWIGFVAIPKYYDVIFEGKRKKLFAIDAGYQLANLLVMALIVGAW